MNRTALQRGLDVGLDGNYTLEQVSTVATKLLSGVGYSEAAKKAISLLDACRHELHERSKRRAAHDAGQAKALAMDAAALRHTNGVARNMKWKEALKFITGGEKREERSFTLFKAFTVYQFRASQATRYNLPLEQTDVPAEADINQHIDRYKRGGIDSRHAYGLREEFKKWKPTYKTEVAKRNASGKRKQPNNELNQIA